MCLPWECIHAHVRSVSLGPIAPSSTPVLLSQTTALPTPAATAACVYPFLWHTHARARWAIRVLTARPPHAPLASCRRCAVSISACPTRASTAACVCRSSVRHRARVPPARLAPRAMRPAALRTQPSRWRGRQHGNHPQHLLLARLVVSVLYDVCAVGLQCTTSGTSPTIRVCDGRTARGWRPTTAPAQTHSSLAPSPKSSHCCSSTP